MTQPIVAPFALSSEFSPDPLTEPVQVWTKFTRLQAGARAALKRR